MQEKINTGRNVCSDIVLSSRVRLARNIQGIPFPVRLNTIEKQKLNLSVCKALLNAGLPLKVIDMGSIYPYEAISLAERHLISPEFASGSEGRFLLISEDESISIMLCEKDHIRIQGFSEGLAPEAAYEKASLYDDILSSAVHYAFDNKLGFLNQNPSDLGTGMRASVLMHLPALSRTGAMAKFSITAGKLGFRIRGSYGDGASAKGDIFRISNYITMGISEEKALENLKSIALQLATRERDAAEELINDISTVDRINRAEGLLKNAVLLSADEMTELLSWVRLGAVYGINKCSITEIDRMFTAMQPASLNVLAGGKLTAAQRSEIRAKTVKTIFRDNEAE